MVPEARLHGTEHGMVPAGEGWFVLDARAGRWRSWEGLGARLAFEGDTEFPQVGINLYVLGPGEPMGMYHREADLGRIELRKRDLPLPIEQLTFSITPNSDSGGTIALAWAQTEVSVPFAVVQ